MIYVRDLISAIWAWVSIWGMDNEKIQRRKQFINDVLSDRRKRQWPYKILMAAYEKKLNQ